MKEYNHKVYVFESPHARNKPISSALIGYTIRRTRLKDKMTAHGMRSLASTYLNEQLFNPYVIESLLAHSTGNAIKMTYDKARYEKQKRDIIQAWADYCEKCGLVIE